MNSARQQDYKINILKFVAFFTLITKYQKDKLREKSIAIALKNNKNQGIKLNEEVKVLHFENYKTLVKESNDTPCLRIRKIKAIYRFNAICVNIPKVIFTNPEQIFLKFTWKQKES